MKYIISLLFFTISLFGFDYHLKSYNVANGVECFFGLSSTANKINGGNIVNSCYIKTSEGYVVIDSGPTYSYAQQANQVMREKEPLPVKYVINTTAEEVHILGSSFYQEQGAILLGPKEHKKYEHKNIFKLEKSVTEDTFQNTHIVPLDRYIESDESIYVGELKINIIKIIENSNRYLIVHIPQRGIVFVGDIVFNNRLPSLKDGRSIDHWLEALKRIEKMSWERLISSHGINTRSSAIKNTKSYLTSLKNNSKKEKVVQKKVVEEKIIKKQIIKKRVVVPNIRYYDFNKAIKKATANRKLVLIKIRSDNCPFCDELDAIFLKNNEVKRLINQNFVMVKMNNSRAQLPLGIEVGVTPSLAFIRADTQEVKMIIPGIESLSELINTLKEGIADGHRGGYLN